MKATIMPVFAARSFTFGAVDGETYYYVTDGNKNVTALLDADGVRVAKYTYNPFGRILNSEGALAEINPFRFSSEYHDDETGLVYYNYRYYSPELGRWIKRDPIEEEGGVNLYAMVWNDSINLVDFLGLGTFEINDKSPGELNKLVRPEFQDSAIYGYEVLYHPDSYECVGGHIVLVQYISDTNPPNYKHDGYAPENWVSSTGHQRKGAYTDPWNADGKQGTLDPEQALRGGAKSDRYTIRNGGYVDAPRKIFMGSQGQAYHVILYFLKVESYCRCFNADDYFLKSQTFKYQRNSDGTGYVIK